MNGTSEGVALRTLRVAGMPMVLAVLGDDHGSRTLGVELVNAGLAQIPGLVGHELPKGARVGFTLDASQLRLVDEQDNTLLRASRDGLDAEWVAEAVRMRGTMLVVLDGEPPQADLDAPALIAELDAAAGRGEARAAVIGVYEEPTKLPLIF